MRVAILTVSANCFDDLLLRYTECQEFLSQDLIWLVKDTGFCQNTTKFFMNLENPFVIFLSESDLGIYDAFNQALTSQVEFDYYLPSGSDDKIDFVTLISLMRSIKDKRFDFICCSVRVGNRIRTPKKLVFLYFSSSRFVSSHSVGTLILRDLHYRFGFYDITYKILADSKFIKIAAQGGASRLLMNDYVLGDFCLDGISTQNKTTGMREAFRYQVETGGSQFVQYLFFAVRVIKFWLINLLRQ